MIITDKKQCCNCTACASICPQKCITMKPDNEGFKYPIVNVDKCIKCGLCEKVCPVIHNEICKINDFDLKGYIVRDKRSEVVSDSTSGGFFTVLAEYVLERNGIVWQRLISTLEFTILVLIQKRIFINCVVQSMWLVI